MERISDKRIGSVSLYGSLHGSLRSGPDSSLSKETLDVLELGLAALAFGTPAASEAGSIHTSMLGESVYDQARGVSNRADYKAESPSGSSHETTKVAHKEENKEEENASAHSGQQNGEDQARGPGDGVTPSIRVPKLPLPDDTSISLEEAAERDQIRREILDKMQAMRKKMSEEKAAASPAPVAIKSPVSQRSPSRSLPPVASSGTANLREGDAFWKNLLSDLRLLDKDVDKANQDVRLDDLDVPYRGRRSSSRGLSYRKFGDPDGSYPSSLISSRSPSPGALDNPFRAAAKRETLLGASLNSEYGASLRSSTSSLDENFGANVPNSAEKRLPDLGSDWQKDVDRIGLQALGMLDRPNQSYTEALITRQIPKEIPSDCDSSLSVGQSKGQLVLSPHLNGRLNENTTISTKPPADLQVRCTVNSRGAAAHVTWQAAFESWPSFSPASGLLYEVQMIVRWISDQEWNTLYTVTDTNCTVEGLKPSYPFAVRVKAIGLNWASEYTAPFEFVTEQSQTTEEVLSLVAADVQESKAMRRRAEGKVVMSDLQSQPSQSQPYQAPTYLERLMQIRQERAEKQEHEVDAKRNAAPLQMVAIANGSHVQHQAKAVSQGPRVDHEVHVTRTSNNVLPYQTHNQSGHQLQQKAGNPKQAGAVERVVREEHKLMQRLTPADSNYGVYRQAVAEGGQKVVRRITLEDPANPHHEFVKKHYAQHYRRDVAIAPIEAHPAVSESAPGQPQPKYASSSSVPQDLQPPIRQESEKLYGSIYQAKRHVANTAVLAPTVAQTLPELYTSDRQATHVTPLTYKSVSPERLSEMATDDIGPLARALGVSQYAPKEEVDRLALASCASSGAARRVVSRDKPPTLATGLPVARAVRVVTPERSSEGERTAQNAQDVPSLSGSVSSRRSVI